MNSKPKIERFIIQDSDPPFNEGTMSMGTYAGCLYFGTRNFHGANLFRLTSAGVTERVLVLEKHNVDIYGLLEHDGYLYMGTHSMDGCELFRMKEDHRPQRLFRRGFDDVNNIDTWTMLFHGGRLYWGTCNKHTGAKLYLMEDDGTIRRIYDTNQQDHTFIRKLLLWNGTIYAAVGLQCPSLHLLCIEGVRTLHQIPAALPPPRSDIYTMCVFRGELYLAVSVHNSVVPYCTRYACEVWRYDGRHFHPCSAPGFGNINNVLIPAMTVFADRLVCATYNYRNGCELWALCDGERWEQLAAAGIDGDPTNECVISSLATYQDKLWVGTRNPTKGFRLFAVTLS